MIRRCFSDFLPSLFFVMNENLDWQAVFQYFNWVNKTIKRISGAGFLLLSGMGTGSFGRLLNFLVMIGFTSMESVKQRQLATKTIRFVRKQNIRKCYSSSKAEVTSFFRLHLPSLCLNPDQELGRDLILNKSPRLPLAHNSTPQNDEELRHPIVRAIILCEHTSKFHWDQWDLLPTKSLDWPRPYGPS